MMRCFFLLLWPLLLLTSLLAQEPNAAVVLLEKEVYFTTGNSDLDTYGKAVIAEMAERWQEQKLAFIEVNGHTDGTGSAAANMALATRRAEAVKAHLLTLGLEEYDVSIIASGELFPRASNETFAGRARNRRATLSLVSLEPALMVKGALRDRENGRPIRDAEIVVETEKGTTTLWTDERGRFEGAVPEGEEVYVAVLAPGYFFKTKRFRLNGRALPPLKVSLPRVVAGEIFPLSNMHFYGDSPKLLPASQRELPVLLRFMRMNPEVRVEIAGHINGIMYPIGGEPERKFQLSVDRARVVYQYLRENDIAASRMTYQGYGNREMRFPSPSATSRQQALNRRVEIRILETGEVISHQLEKAWK